MDAHLPNVNFNQCSTQKTRDIKWTYICVMSSLINALPRKLVILNGRTFAHLPTQKTDRTFDLSINALPRKLVILNGRIFAECRL